MKKIFRFLFLASLSSVVYGQEIKEDASLWKKFRDYTPVAKAIFMGNLDNAGMSPRAIFQPNFPSWNKIHDSINEDMQFERCDSIECDTSYERDMAEVTNGRLAYAEKIELLDNEESFSIRKKLIQNARNSIYVMVWAIYNDETGKEFEELLMDAIKKNPKLDIKIIVDGNIATMPGHWENLLRLKERSKGKIRTIHWKSWKYRANGTHRKLFIVDNEHVITGGLNIGNHYSHKVVKHPEDAWRDFDVYMYGPSVGTQAHNQFARVWNYQIDESDFYKEYGIHTPLERNRSTEGTPVVLADQDPGSARHKATHHIHSAVTKIFRNAKKTIDIENAYFILDPIVREELKAALKRGIQVRIFTNSKESVDEDIVTLPILTSAQEAARMGAEIYLKKGATLHSKYMIVDDKISFIGSFNFHPRSLKLDGENVAIIFDEKFAQTLSKKFLSGIKEATYITDPNLIYINFHLMSFLTKNICYDCF